MSRSTFGTVIGLVHALLRRALLALRWVWYQLTIFVWSKPVPRSTRFYGRLRCAYVPAQISMGQSCGIGHNVALSAGRNASIALGDMVTINDNSILVASELIQIGSRVAIGENVSIRDQQHIHVAGKGVRDQGFHVEPVLIGANTWIGRGAFIGPGSKIGKDCIIAANSVVHGEFPDGVLIAGAPASIRKTLSDGAGAKPNA